MSSLAGSSVGCTYLSMHWGSAKGITGLVMK